MIRCVYSLRYDKVNKLEKIGYKFVSKINKNMSLYKYNDKLVAVKSSYNNNVSFINEIIITNAMSIGIKHNEETKNKKYKNLKKILYIICCCNCSSIFDYQILDQQYLYNDVAKYIDSFIYKNETFLITKYAGIDLWYYVKSKNKLTEPEAKKIFLKIVDTIIRLHNLGISHSDLSLENICIKNDKSGNIKIKLIDFGLSQVHHLSPYFSKVRKDDSKIITNHESNKSIKYLFCSIKHTDTFYGKNNYMSPERYNAHFSDTKYCAFKDDIFSLGVMLYILLIGHPPFESANIEDKFFKSFIDGSWSRNEIISPLASDLINRIIKHEKKRIVIDDIINHQWCI